MKFSCDDCGAQYMIADDKIGPRGVKVRCKKCANVIVLRPNGAPASVAPPAPPPSSVAPPPAPPAERSEKAIPMAAMPFPAPRSSSGPLPPFEAPRARKTAQPPPPPDSDEDEDEATIAFAAKSRAPSTMASLASEGIGVSSDLGLSQEFAAKGFDPPSNGEREKPKVLADVRAQSLNADVDARPAPSQGSPFSGLSMGGSLGSLASEEHTPTPHPASPLSARAGLGSEGPTHDVDIKTSVDQGPELKPRILADDEHDLGLGGEGPATARGAAVPQPGQFEEDIDTRVGQAHLDKLPLDPPRRLVSDLDDGARPARGGFGDLEQGEIDRNFESTLPVNGHAPKPRSPTPAAPSVPRPAPSAPSRGSIAPNGGRLSAAEGASLGGENLEEEIGHAFESVFGAGAGLDETDGYGAPSQPPPEEERKETRAFDSDALKRLSSEQSLAQHRAETPFAPQPPPPPDRALSNAKEWYVAISDEQVGPLSLLELQGRWDKGDVDANSLSWKQGMGDWIAIRFVRELEALTQGSEPTNAKVQKADLSNEPPTRAHVVAMAASPAASSPAAAAVSLSSAASSLSGIGRPSFGASSLSLPTHDETKEQPRPAAVLANVPGDPREPTEPSEPSWRPSAASALASLAQAELESSSARIGKEGASPALPSGRPSYAPLSAASFGAGEQTSTRSGNLPKSGDLASSVSLRDPVSGHGGPKLSMPVAVLGGSVILAVVVLGVVFSLRKDPVPVVAAPTPTPATVVVSPSLRPEPTTAPATVPPVPTASTAIASAPPVPVASATPAPIAAADPRALPGDRREKGRRLTKDREAGAPVREPREARGKKEKDPLEVVAPEPVKPVRNERVEADDLLAEGDSKPKGRPTPVAAATEGGGEDLPDQLDETDILRVLRKYKGEINACKEKQAKDDPSLEGVMTVNMVVLKSGRTSQPVVAPDKFRTSAVGKCVLNSVKGWKFPQFTGRPMPIDFPVPVRGRG